MLHECKCGHVFARLGNGIDDWCPAYWLDVERGSPTFGKLVTLCPGCRMPLQPWQVSPIPDYQQVWWLWKALGSPGGAAAARERESAREQQEHESCKRDSARGAGLGSGTRR